ncbi:MAG: sugar ABC transporter permease [Oscillospiraceae bacterium]|nr:sugar ABC transporter permease [Oscillospiraceae bacterium]
MAASTEQKTKNKPKRLRSLEKQQRSWGWLFLSPWLVGITLFFVLPMFQSVLYSFSKILITDNGFELESVGFKNYLYFFTESTTFGPYLTETIWQIIPSVLMILAFSTVIALVLKSNFFGRSLARAVFFFPVIIASGVVITILKDQVMMSGSSVSDMSPSYLFQAPDLVNTFSQLGIPDQLLSSITTILNQIFDLTWKSGVQILLLLAAVNNIPGSFYEVADMEGATAWEKFWKITFPTISPTMLVVITYTIIDSFTDYGNLIMQMLQDYYRNNNYAYSATIGVIYFVCILLVIGLVNLICRKFIFYASE